MQTAHTRLWTRPYILLIITGTLTSTGFYMVNPCIAQYAVSIGSTLTQAGMIAGFYSITALPARPASGLLADRWNKKKLLLAATLLLALAAFGYSLCRTILALLALRIAHGIAFAVSGTVNAALITSLIPRARISEGIGYFGLANIFATAVGPSLGMGLAEALGYGACFRISAAVILAGLACAARIGFPPARPAAARKLHIQDLVSLNVLPLAILGGLFSMSNGIISSYLALLGDVRRIAGISLYFTVNAAVLVFVRPFSGRLADRKGAAAIVFPALALDGLALFTLGLTGALPAVLLAAVFKALGQGSGQLTLQSEALKTLPPEKSGVASSTFYIGGDIGQGLGPMAAGWLIDSLGEDSAGYGAAFAAAGCLFLCGILFYALYTLRRRAGRRAQAERTE